MRKRNYLSAQITGGFMKGLLFIAAMAFIIVMPQVSVRNVSASTAIDETMPSSIPSDVAADWKAQGRNDNAAAHAERVKRIKQFADQIQKIVFTKHFNVGGAIIGYTEDLNSDGAGNIGGKFAGISGMSKGSSYKSGGGMYMLDFKNYYPTPTTLLDAGSGVVRDPCVSFDGSKVVFAWSQKNNGYNLYELALADKTTRPLTSNPASHVVSDFEPCYCPDGNIIFVSSRCFNHVDCNFNLSSNLYLCNKDGKYIRRISYDQVNIFYPTCTDQGLIIYGRWEYNDRNVMDCFGIFTMNPDGSHQTELFGNQLSAPAGIPCASWIPNGGGKFFATTAVHMSSIYQGDLIYVDPTLGRNKTSACTKIGRANGGQPSANLADGDKKYQYPCALDENWFLVSYAPSGSGLSATYNLYLMNKNGDRELLASGGLQGKPACVRKVPPKVASTVNWNLKTAVVAMTNAYYGQQTGNTVSKGSIKKIRAIALNYRVHPWVGNTGANAYTATPVARYNGSWESKRVLGEMPVEDDGSACFYLPARTPIYFQLIDASGCAIQHMRSWTTLMPGERWDCYGCHEDKNTSNPPATPKAIQPKELQPFYGRTNFYFHYDTMLQQPVIDKKCVTCHKSGHSSGLDLTSTRFWTGDLSNDADNNTAERFWNRSYYNLSVSKYVNYIQIFSMAPGLRPNSTGSVVSNLIKKLKAKSGGMAGVDIIQEDIDRFAMWQDLCIPFSGDYVDDMKPADRTKYEARLKIRKDLEAVENKDLADCIAAKDPSCPTEPVGIINNVNGNSTNIVSLFDVQCLANGSKLVLRLPGAGKIALMDMLGRRIITQSISKEVADNAVTLRTRLPKGIYIIKFNGASSTQHKVINVL
jgi:hypothetical protein